jgi:hypothetical protein
MQLPFQVPAVPRFNRCFAGDIAVIVPSAAKGKEAKPKKSRGDKDGYGQCGGQYTLQCPTDQNMTCCNPDTQMCLGGKCYPYV